MPTKRTKFLDSPECDIIRRQLKTIAEDVKYKTESSYSANSDLYPDNLIPFIDKHINYLNSHPQLDVNKYLANIKLMSRIR